MQAPPRSTATTAFRPTAKPAPTSHASSASSTAASSLPPQPWPTASINLQAATQYAETSPMKNRKGLAWLAILLVLALVVYANRGRIHFDWAMFFQQLRRISWPHIAAGVALIYSTYWLRAARWSVFISSTKKVSPFALVGPQFIGFTAVALFGRLADVIRPALVAKRVNLPVASQIAVYTIERMFHLGAAAIIFSGALLFVPRDVPHHEIFLDTGKAAAFVTLGIAAFAVIIRVAGGAIASAVHALLHPLSHSIAD